MLSDSIENKIGKININITEAKKAVEIEVSDNGKGIDFKKKKRSYSDRVIVPKNAAGV